MIWGYKNIYKKIENLNITPQKPIKNIQIDGENLNVNDGVYKIKSVKKNTPTYYS